MLQLQHALDFCDFIMVYQAASLHLIVQGKAFIEERMQVLRLSVRHLHPTALNIIIVMCHIAGPGVVHAAGAVQSLPAQRRHAAHVPHPEGQRRV
jgi:hypothetical protein